MQFVNINEAKTYLSRLVRRASRGSFAIASTCASEPQEKLYLDPFDHLLIARPITEEMTLLTTAPGVAKYALQAGALQFPFPKNRAQGTLLAALQAQGGVLSKAQEGI